MADRLSDNLAKVRADMADAAKRSGRKADDVTLLAVTKTAGQDVVRRLYHMGERHFGENRIHVAEPKINALNLPDACWHFIGHLQRNKAKSVVGCCTVLHSLDSLRLAEELARHVADEETLSVFLEVKTSEEDSKLGLSGQDVPDILEKILTLPQLHVRGLMTMAPYADDPEMARPYFQRLRALRDQLELTVGVRLPDLSMGMSHDYVVAIEEGATVVRVGSALFEGLSQEEMER